MWQRSPTPAELVHFSNNYLLILQKQLEEINTSLASEYQLRKSMLLRRLDATKLAFQMAPELQDPEVMEKLNADIKKILSDGHACGTVQHQLISPLQLKILPNLIFRISN